MPGQQTTAIKNKKERPYTKADSMAQMKELEGEWLFDNIAGINITGEDDRPALIFNENSTRFYAYNGCNYFNGNYRLTGFNKISFEQVVSTTNFCPDISWCDYITALWNVASKFYVSKHGSEEYLRINDSNDRSLATLKRHQLRALNGLWTITRINNRYINADNPTIVIDLIEKTVHGNSGCNLFNGIVYQDPDTERSVQFQNMAVTHMSCPNIAIETAFLIALEQVEKAKIENDDLVILTDKNGTPLLYLARTSL